MPEEDVVHERVDHLIEERVPWILLGLIGGLLATLIVAKFENILTADLRLAFFIPIIVYLGDAIGTQSEAIYIRALAKGQIRFGKYVLKESLIGIGLGVIAGTISGIFAGYWLGSFAVGITIALTMLVNLTFAPVLAITIPTILYREHKDPALGASPLATILQDMISLIVFFWFASIFLF